MSGLDGFSVTEISFSSRGESIVSMQFSPQDEILHASQKIVIFLSLFRLSDLADLKKFVQVRLNNIPLTIITQTHYPLSPAFLNLEMDS